MAAHYITQQYQNYTAKLLTFQKLEVALKQQAQANEVGYQNALKGLRQARQTIEMRNNEQLKNENEQIETSLQEYFQILKNSFALNKTNLEAEKGIIQLVEKGLEAKKTEVAQKFKEQINRDCEQIDKQIEELTQQYNKSKEIFNQQYKQVLKAVQEAFEPFNNYYPTASWESSIWQELNVTNSFPESPYVNIGAKECYTDFFNNSEKTEIQLLESIINTTNLIVAYENETEIISFLDSFVARIILSCKVGGVKIKLIDTYSAGQLFENFSNSDKKYISNISSNNELTTLFGKLQTEINTLIQDKTVNTESKDLQVLIISNIDKIKFYDNDVFQYVLRNGPKAGIITIILKQNEVELKNLNISNNKVIEVENLKINEKAQSISEKVIELLSPASILNFKDIIPEEKYWFSKDASENFEVTLGGLGEIKYQLEFTTKKGDNTGALIVGNQGMGKSNLLELIVINTLLNYSPNDVVLYLMDFKRVTFNRYENRNIPTIQGVFKDCDREFGLSMIRLIHNEMDFRQTLFGQNNETQNIADYNRINPTKKLPRIILIIDEANYFIDGNQSYNDAITDEINSKFKDIIFRGRSTGINIILTAQTVRTLSLDNTTKEKFATRIALKCSDDEARYMLDHESDARKLKHPGNTLLNKESGRNENSFFQHIRVDEQIQEDLLKRIAERYTDKLKDYKSTIGFDGQASAKLDQSLILDNKNINQLEPHIWVGEPIIAGMFNLAFPLKKGDGQNVLFIGGDRNEFGKNSLTNALVSLAINNYSKAGEFYIYNCANDITLNDYCSCFKNALVLERDKILNNLFMLKEELTNRKTNNKEITPLYLFIFDLQQYGKFARDNEETEILLEIINNGSAFGVHVLLNLDFPKNINKVFGDINGFIGEFTHRILFKMSGTDSDYIINNDYANKLDSNGTRALYYNSNDEEIIKFKPYELPSKAWLMSKIK